mgnify:CR=1 FL=1
MELISKYTASSEFADLHEEVQKAYEQAVGSDANLKTMLETTLTGAIKQWYTSSGIANLKKSDADTQTTEADTQQADDASQSGDQQTTDANAGQTAEPADYGCKCRTVHRSADHRYKCSQSADSRAATGTG